MKMALWKLIQHIPSTESSQNSKGSNKAPTYAHVRVSNVAWGNQLQKHKTNLNNIFLNLSMC